MPAWILILLNVLPSLIKAVADAIKSNPPAPSAAQADLDAHQANVDALELAHQHVTNVKI